MIIDVIIFLSGIIPSYLMGRMFMKIRNKSLVPDYPEWSEKDRFVVGLVSCMLSWAGLALFFIFHCFENMSEQSSAKW